MILPDDLKKIFLDNNILAFEVTGLTKGFDENSIQLIGNDIKVMIEFCKNNNIKSVFYMYGYYNREDYFIEEEQIKSEFRHLFEDDIEKYNFENSKIDFDKPDIVVVFTIYQDRYVSFIEQNDWLKNEGFLSVDEFFGEIQERYNSELERIEKEKKQEKDQLLEEFKKVIIEETNFKNCTNQKLRRQFSNRIFEDEKMKKYEKLFPKNGKITDMNIYDFIELLWKEYKESKNKVYVTFDEWKNRK